jgi:colanic acid/amylovoran biosynthesis glycosyltransferase
MNAPGRTVPLRVLYVLKRFPRLSETFILAEMLRLEQEGVEIGVESIKAAEIGSRHPEVSDLRAELRYLPSSGSQSVATMIANRARTEQFQHIHAHFATSAAETAIAAGQLAALPVTVTCHAKDIFHTDYASTLPARLAGVSGLVTVSDYNRRHLLAEVPGVPVHLVYNGIGRATESDRNPRGPILCIARLVEKKGVDLLVRATAELARNDVSTRVEIVGDGPLRDRLKELVNRLEIGKNVSFLGPLTSPEVDAAFRRASMFVLPCRIDRNGDRDGMPTVLGEAMARKLPVISTDLVGIPELIRHGETGLLVPPENHLALADAITTLRNDPILAGELATKGQAQAATLLDPAVATDRLIKVFESAGRGC